MSEIGQKTLNFHSKWYFIYQFGKPRSMHHWQWSLKVKQNNTWITNDTDHVEIIGPSIQWGSYFVQPRNLFVSWLGKLFLNFSLKLLNPWCPDTKLHVILNRNNTGACTVHDVQVHEKYKNRPCPWDTVRMAHKNHSCVFVTLIWSSSSVNDWCNVLILSPGQLSFPK